MLAIIKDEVISRHACLKRRSKRHIGQELCKRTFQNGQKTAQIVHLCGVGLSPLFFLSMNSLTLGSQEAE